MVECVCFWRGFHRVLVCCDWFHAAHELYSDFSCSLLFAGVAVVFVSMWVVDRCASPQMLEVSFRHAFPTSMDRTISTSCCCVCFTSGFVLRVPATECVHV